INSTNNEEAILKSCSVLCIDEFHKGSFKDIAAGLQTFMENGKVSRGKESYYSDTSIIMFANFKEEDMYKKFFINPKEFNPFKNIPEIDDAFLQRINYINPSFGMRALQPNLFINKTTPRVPISIYEKLFEELRCLDFDFKEIFPNLKILQEDNIESEVRVSSSIIQVANAFFKLLFPNKIEQITLYKKGDNLFEVKVCFYLAMEGYSILNALKNKPTNLYVSLDNKNNGYFIYLSEFNLYKEIIEYFLDSTNLYNSVLFPHRYLECSRDNNGDIYFKRVPLDTIGIEQNLNEFNIYNTLIPNSISANDFLSSSIKNPNIILENFDYNTSNTQTIYLNNLKVNKYFVRLRELYKNYLYGYKINTNGCMDFIGNLGNCTIISQNEVICPSCKREIILNFGSDGSPTNGANLLRKITCESCKKEIYNYDLFPKFFKDYSR
ncbi:MAG: BREX system Lon protease-like protein BrxL, partial [Cetobacterium somerae]|uniref:BREX system Lon protease-like protein BrxL n=1 Tax=Cetobacterium somerae TaxID=188913 RepID=UPI003F3FDF62